MIPVFVEFEADFVWFFDDDHCAFIRVSREELEQREPEPSEKSYRRIRL